MATIQASRFALLKVDDDNDDNQTSKNKKNNENKAEPQAAKKRNRKKKKADQNKAESDELRSIAFGGGGKAKKRTTSQSGSADPVPQAQWDQWKQADEEFTQEEYEKNLQKALLESRLDYEEKKEVTNAIGEQNGTDKKNKKKKKDNKPAPMSLEQFNQMAPAKKKPVDSDDSEEEELPVKPPVVTEVSEPDPTFFDNVKKDVAKTLQKERIQEEYKKQYAMESALVRQLREDLEKKNETIEKLKKGNKDLKTELKQAKDRTTQLCSILSNGEMKSKAEILSELEDSRRLHEELNQEVSTLTQALEQEKSKVHALTAELANKNKGKK